MTKGEELFNQWKAWNTRENEHEQNAVLCMVTFRAGFLEFLSPPDDLIVASMVGVDPTQQGLAMYREEKTGTAALTVDGDRYRFALKVRIGQGGQFLFMYFDIGLRIDSVGGEIEFIDQSKARFDFPLELVGKGAFSEAYAHMFDTLQRTLSLTPWERAQKAPIGFSIAR